MEVRITETYTDNRLNCGKTYGITNIETLEEFINLVLIMSKESPVGEIILSFPNKDKDTIMVETYNGYRE